MSTQTHDVIPTPMPQRIENFKRRWVPVLIWSVTALICLVLLTGRASRSEYVGLAQAIRYEVSAPTGGQLEAVLVDPHEDIEPGDIVATLDDARLAARVARSNARIAQLQAEFEASRSELVDRAGRSRSDWSVDLRRFQTDEQRQRLDLLELRAQLEGDQIELERLALELQRFGSLIESGLVGRNEYDGVRLAHDELKTRIEEGRILQSQTEDELDAATARRREFERSLPSVPPEEPLLAPLRAAVEVESHRMEEIELERRSLVLRSPIGGRVSQVLCRRGQSVVAGEPIVTIAERNVREVVAWLREGDRLEIGPSQPVQLTSRTRPGRTAESVVLRTGAALEPLPERLWRDPSRPDYGRAVVIAASPALDLTPGELLDVRFDRR